MITEALQHCPGIGPAQLAKLHHAGIRSWFDVLAAPDCIPKSCRTTILDECRLALQALETDDIGYFVDRFSPRDKWRILSHYLDQTSFFDIETTGLEFDATITVIVCWHRGQLHTFVEHENLDDFLHLLDDIRLLASFNGSTFDVPRVLDAFHIPALPCPHLDLRWPCYHQGLTGGLKDITARIGIWRPADLQQTDGAMAVQWWSDWQNRRDAAARGRLIRYCAADVLLLVLLSGHLAERPDTSSRELWGHLPHAATAPPERTAAAAAAAAAAGGGGGGGGAIRTGVAARSFGTSSPLTLRARRRLR